MLRRRTKPVPVLAGAAGFTLAEITRMAHDLESLRNAAEDVLDVWIVEPKAQEVSIELADAIVTMSSELLPPDGQGPEGGVVMNKRYALIPALFALASCDTSKVTALGEVVFHANPAPAEAANAIPVSPDRTPQLHSGYEPCAELMTNNPACPQAPTHFDRAPEIGDAIEIAPFPRTVTLLPDTCQVVVRIDGTRYENGAQQPCAPCVEHATEQSENGCAYTVVAP